MKTGTFFYVKWMRSTLLLLLLTVWLWPAPLLADAALAVGLLGGALVGSLVGPAKNRGQNALIGAVAGGALTHLSTAPVDEQPSPSPHPYPKQPMPRYTMPDLECRQMETQGFVNGRQETLVGTACRTEGGSWQYQEMPRIVSRTVIYQQPQTIIVEPAPVVTPYPVPHTTQSEPHVVMLAPPKGRHQGRYYGHRGYWREHNLRHLDW
ncbi:MAG: hypothetical protein HQL80_04210 [Magnetococcales bacterium]|nr:hypothetical protein [Magnetococcales bacterium]